MGPMLPEGVLEGDGADRGIIFIAAGAHLERQYEFVRTEWVDQGLFFGTPDEKDPLVRPTQPVFMINGKHDHLAPIGNIYFMLESGPPSKRTARIYGDAGHCAFRYQSDWAPASFRWLEQKLTADSRRE